MIGDREHPNRPTDYGAIWMGHGVDLADRMLALAHQLETEGHTTAATRIREVLDTDYDPRPDTRPARTLPLRPAVPPHA